MFEPIVFLDIDGVLNSVAWYDRRGPRPENRPLWEHNIDPVALGRLNWLCKATGACVVVSSHWRHGRSIDQLQHDFAYIGCTAWIVGRTPDLADTERTRGDEIAQWLRTHGPVAGFVILDDGGDMGALRTNLVQTAVATGLTDADVERAIAILRPSPLAPPAQ